MYVSTDKVDYRALVRQHADQARALLNAADEQSPIYAGLELRMALEAAVYEIAQEFLEDLPADHATWQPQRLLRRLLEIDPGADSPHEVHVQLPVSGQSEGDWVSLGKEQRLSLKAISEHYGALGSYMHAPTLASLQRGKQHNADRLRKRCGALLSQIDDILASTLWNLNLRITSETTVLRVRRSDQAAAKLSRG